MKPFTNYFVIMDSGVNHEDPENAYPARYYVRENAMCFTCGPFDTHSEALETARKWNDEERTQDW
jgi:hypothetical protein